MQQGVASQPAFLQGVVMQDAALQGGEQLALPSIRVSRGDDIEAGGADVLGDINTAVPGVFTYTIHNDGIAVLVVSAIATSAPSNCTAIVTDNPASPTALELAPGGSDTFEVTFDPAATGALEALLTVESNDPSTPAFAFTGQGTGIEQDIAVSRWGVDVPTGGGDALGDTNTVTGRADVYLVRNVGDDALTWTSIALDNEANCSAVLSDDPTPVVLNPGGSDTFSVDIDPTATGVFGYRWILDTDDPDEDPYVVSPSGTGIEQEIAVSDPATAPVADGGSYAAGDHRVGVAFDEVWTVQNVGTDTLGSLSVSLANKVNCTATVTEGLDATIPASGSDTFTVQVTPSGNGAYSYDVDIMSDDVDEPNYDVTSSGAGVQPEINVLDPDGNPVADEGSYASAGGTEGVPAVHTWTVQNTGTSLLTCSVSLANKVNCTATVTEGLDATIPASGSDTFQVTITPTAAGAWSYDVDVTSDDDDEPNYDVAVSGTAVAAGLTNAYSLIGDGTDDYCSSSASYAAFEAVNQSVACWVKVPASPSGARAFWGYNVNSNGQGIQLTYETASHRLELLYGGTTRKTAYLTEANYDLRGAGWKHLVVVREGLTSSGWKFYVDGSPVTTTNDGGTANAPVYNASYRIWLNRRGNGDYSNIPLDEPAFFDYALSAAQVAAIYAAYSTGYAADLTSIVGVTAPVAWYRCGDDLSDDGTATTGQVTDQNGTLHLTPYNNAASCFAADVP